MKLSSNVESFLRAIRDFLVKNKIKQQKHSKSSSDCYFDLKFRDNFFHTNTPKNKIIRYKMVGLYDYRLDDFYVIRQYTC